MIRDFFAESLVFSLVFLVRVDPTKYRPLISGLHLLAAAIQQITAMKDFFHTGVWIYATGEGVYKHIEVGVFKLFNSI